MKLYQFSFSHFCEKARWALDLAQLDYQVENLAPGLHRPVLALKQAGTTVPVLETDHGLVSGSTEITRFALAQNTSHGVYTEPSPTFDQWHSRIANDVGRSLQTLVYSVLLDHPENLLALWADNFLLKMTYRAAFTPVKDSLVKLYDITPGGIDNAHASLTTFLSESDRLVQAHGHLVKDGFTCVDLALAALMAPVVLPPEFSCTPLFQTTGITAVTAEFRNRYDSGATADYVRQLYHDYRLSH